MRLMKALLIGACPIVLCAAPVLAQSTASQQIETVTVSGTRVNLSGLASTTQVAKQMSTITQDFIATQTPGQTFFENLNYLPGVNFTSDDPYGTSGGDIHMHGQDGAHISVTLDGMPLNDTGNYAMYPNQMLDPEILGRVQVNQGTTDVDSPTAAVTGGSISAITERPYDEASVYGTAARGTHDFQRYAFRLDTGKIGPYGTKAFFGYSYQDYNNAKGPGKMRKTQFNAGVYQDFGSAGWLFVAAHFNRNRNNSQNYNSSYTGGLVDADWSSANGYSATCAGQTAVAGTADVAASCNYWSKVKVNPSDTGNVRMSSLWHLAQNLTLTVDSSLQYTVANGGGAYSTKENMGALAATPAGATYNANAYKTAKTSAYGCVANVGCDLNGDGDLLDSVLIYEPSNTNTRRWGFNSSLIYEPISGHTFRMAYTLDYGLHRQTAHYAYMDYVSGPYSVFGGLDDPEHRVKTSDGSDLRYRDRKSKAILNQASFDYQGDYLNGMIHASFGFRLPFFERDLNQYCYEQAGTSTPYCTTEVEKSYDATSNTVTFASGTNKYVRPASTVKRYNRFLPHLGMIFKPFGDEHQFYVSYTQELAAPKTDDLYSSTVNYVNKVAVYSTFENTKPETSATYTIGYRFTGEDFGASMALWNTQVKNRIVSAYDEDQRISTHRNVKGINFSGVDFDMNYQVTPDLLFYGSASYTSARIIDDLQMGASSVAYTAGKQFSDTPKWMLSGRMQYHVLHDLKVGLGTKYVASRYASDDNNIRVPDYYTVNSDVIYDLDSLGLDGASLKFNATNLFNKHYYGRISKSVSCYSTASGCSSKASVRIGAPQAFILSVGYKY